MGHKERIFEKCIKSLGDPTKKFILELFYCLVR